MIRKVLPPPMRTVRGFITLAPLLVIFWTGLIVLAVTGRWQGILLWCLFSIWFLARQMTDEMMKGRG
jgi:hypothetical protein